MKRSHNENLTRRHRLAGFDYSTPGYYFITFGTLDGRNVLAIDDEAMELTALGQYLFSLISGLADRYPDITIDAFAIMPNHVHLLVYLSLENKAGISDIVRSLKGPCTAEYRRISSASPGRLWHDGFHDEIVRDDRHLDEIRRYNMENPLKWRADDQWR